MPTTTEALIIAALFLAPGLLYEWAVEIRAGYRRPDMANKALRAFTRSVFAQIFLSPLVFLVWRGYRDVDFSRASPASLASVALALLLYVILPTGAGLVSGHRQRQSGGSTMSGWDALFGRKEVQGFVRAKLRSGTWVGGVYGRLRGGDPITQGFASGYPEPESLYLPLQLVLDPASGEIAYGEDGGPLVRDWGLLLHGEDIEVLEFQPLHFERRAS